LRRRLTALGFDLDVARDLRARQYLGELSTSVNEALMRRFQ
jgi:hypothetical protein